MGIVDKLKNVLFADNEPQADENGNYEKRDSLLTEYELVFFNKLRNIYENKYHLQAQVSLRSVTSKTVYSKYINELFRDIDFGIFDYETLKPLVLIELNDKTHKKPERHERDLKVREILNQSGIPLVTFYTDKPNEESYLKERINEELKKYKKGILTKFLAK
ncbi:MAG: DUF2726 domain-containing protein [Clostridia bacterium]|nr:DUF2726 domain-containing protein [Clostridia bacterium]MBQ9793261.1 DUF2726 domain-containing protein [Clostridia bacterium]